MPLHICDKCGKYFPTPSKLHRHNNRKTPCVSVVVENTLLNPTKPYKTLLNPT